MPSPRQTELIKELTNELRWDKQNIADEIGEEYADYEQLDPPGASELISYLCDKKRSKGVFA